MAGVLDYDAEAADYDRTRGGEGRAVAAAEAVCELLPGEARTVVDVACGTGIVSTRLRGPGRVVVGVDISAGMLAYARPRLAGAVARADATRLPIADRAVDAVLFMWLLHLVDAEVGERAVAEAARVLRPGGVLVSTVDKNFAMYRVPSDLSEVLEPVQRAYSIEKTDDPAAFVGLGKRLGLEPRGEATLYRLRTGLVATACAAVAAALRLVLAVGRGDGRNPPVRAGRTPGSGPSPPRPGVPRRLPAQAR